MLTWEDRKKIRAQFVDDVAPLGQAILAQIKADNFSGQFEKEEIIIRLAESDILQVLCEDNEVTVARMIYEVWQAMQHIEVERRVKAELYNRA